MTISSCSCWRIVASMSSSRLVDSHRQPQSHQGRGVVGGKEHWGAQGRSQGLRARGAGATMLSNSLDSALPRLELPIFPRVGTAMPFALPLVASGLLIVRRLCAVGILANMATMAGSVLRVLLLPAGCSIIGLDRGIRERFDYTTLARCAHLHGSCASGSTR
jgi:hypothetical protein